MKKVLEVYEKEDGTFAVQFGEIEAEKLRYVATEVVKAVMGKEEELGAKGRTLLLVTGYPGVSIDEVRARDIGNGLKQELASVCKSIAERYGGYECNEPYEDEDWLDEDGRGEHSGESQEG